MVCNRIVNVTYSTDLLTNLIEGYKMNLEIVQDDTDCVDYLADVRGFLAQKLGAKPTQEQLDSRFDALLTEYAMQQTLQGYTANYEAATKTLTILS